MRKETLALTFAMLWCTAVAVMPIWSASQYAGDQISPGELKNVLEAREAVWRAWFANNREELEKALPADTIGINADQENWENRVAVLKSAEEFAAHGGRLLKLEFPHTDVQLYGNVAVLYSHYLTESEMNGQRTTVSGRATEIFLRRNGRWLNSGWHLDSWK